MNTKLSGKIILIHNAPGNLFAIWNISHKWSSSLIEVYKVPRKLKIQAKLIRFRKKIKNQERKKLRRNRKSLKKYPVLRKETNLMKISKNRQRK